MKEYILVILSGICKAVEERKWPEEPRKPNSHLISENENPDYYLELQDYERQKHEAFEGGALVDDVNSIFNDLQHNVTYTGSIKNLPDGVYPIDPAKWEVVEQWQYLDEKTGRWLPCLEETAIEWIKYKNVVQTRLTATINPKEHNSAHGKMFIQCQGKATINGTCDTCLEPLTSSDSYCKRIVEIQVESEPTIATDSTHCCGKGGLVDGTFHCDRSECIHKPQEPTRKLAMEELINAVWQPKRPNWKS